MVPFLSDALLHTAHATPPLLTQWPTGLTLAQTGTPFVLVGWWKAVVLLIPLGLWAWYISKVLDKHAARFQLPREKYNTIHLVVGTLAFLGVLFIPLTGIVSFIAALATLTVVLLGEVLYFIKVHNDDKRVPEKFQLSLVDFSKFREASDAKKKAGQQGKVELTIRGADKQALTPPNSDTPEYAVRVASEKLYIDAGIARGSQVELVPVPPAAGQPVTQYRVQTLIDGIPTGGEALPAADAVRIIDFWKGAAKLDLGERRKRISGDLTIERADLKRKVRVISQGGSSGQRLMLLFDPDKAAMRELGELGLLDQQKSDLETLTKSGPGLVLVAAPPDGGRTTTFYTIIRMHDAYTSDVQTIELEPQMVLEGVKTTKYEQVADGPEFSTTMRSILRRDPSVLGVAEVPDANTAKEIAKADLDRIRVYACVKADSAVSALQGWVKLVGDADVASKRLSGVVAQKLVRKLCNNCKVAYQPNADMLKKLGLPADQVKQLFKKGGQVMVKDKTETCPQCGGIGYFGQEGIFEVDVLTDTDRQLIRSGDWNSLKLELRKRKLPTLQQAALRKALDGVTSIEEVLRVTTEAQPGAPTSAAPTPPTPPPTTPPTPPKAPAKA